MRPRPPNTPPPPAPQAHTSGTAGCCAPPPPTCHDRRVRAASGHGRHARELRHNPWEQLALAGAVAQPPVVPVAKGGSQAQHPAPHPGTAAGAARARPGWRQTRSEPGVVCVVGMVGVLGVRRAHCVLLPLLLLVQSVSAAVVLVTFAAVLRGGGAGVLGRQRHSRPAQQSAASTSPGNKRASEGGGGLQGERMTLVDTSNMARDGSP